MENQNTPPQVNLTQTQPVQTPPPAGAGQPVSPGSTTPKKKLSLTVIIEAILFILLAGGAAAGFVYREQVVSIFAKPSPTPAPQTISPSPTPDPTANWKTYSGEFYSFKYPSDWDDFKESIGGAKVSGPVDKSSTLSVQDFTYINPSDTPDKLAKLALSVNESPLSLKTIEVDGHYTVIQERETKHGVGIEIYIGEVKELSQFPEQDGGPRITSGTQTLHMTINKVELIEQNRKLLEQILSTFKFTDTQTLDTSSWKTYTMKSAKIRFKYPPDWVLKENPITGENQNETEINGTDGEILVRWDGTGYGGGGCPVQKIAFLGLDKDYCYEKYSASYLFETKDKIAVSIYIKTEEGKADPSLLNTIASTFEVTN